MKLLSLAVMLTNFETVPGFEGVSSALHTDRSSMQGSEEEVHGCTSGSSLLVCKALYRWPRKVPLNIWPVLLNRSLLLLEKILLACFANQYVCLGLFIAVPVHRTTWSANNLTQNNNNKIPTSDEDVISGRTTTILLDICRTHAVTQ